MPEGHRHLTYEERCQIHAPGKRAFRPGDRPPANGIRMGLTFRARFFRRPQPPDIARFPASRNFFA